MFGQPVDGARGNEGKDSAGARETRSQPPAVTLPKGGGAIRGMGEKFAANPVTGGGSFSIPLAASPARGGFGPQLTLTYDSGAGNGPFGLGWNLPLPAITRKTDKGLPRYNDALESDTFILSGAEDLVPELVQVGADWQRQAAQRSLPDGSTWRVQRYRPRVEGAFARIERWTNLADRTDVHWRSITRDNITTLYGKTANARIADPDNPGRIFAWLICESHDDKGNALYYAYKAEDAANVDLTLLHERHRTPAGVRANRYIKHIYYGNRSPYQPGEDLAQRADWMFELVFDYGEHDPADPLPAEQTTWPARQDPFSSYRPGFEVRQYRLCRRVLMFHHFPDEAVGDNCLVRSTDFTFSEGRVASFIISARQFGYARQSGGGYRQQGLPPVDFTYSQVQLDPTVHELDPGSLVNLPYGLDGANYQWVDLDGEGLAGILTRQSGALLYKHNLGGRFGPLRPVETQPALVSSSREPQQLLDLSGDGQLDLVDLAGAAPGFYERTSAEGWAPFTAFNHQPVIDWNDPNLRFVDLDGDGHADVLVTEQEALTWYPSLAEDGFGAPVRLDKAKDERAGPALVFADGEQSIYLADFSGDGLADLVRIRRGEVCYWPNLGYGCFGRRVTLSSAPVFDLPDQFSQHRVRLADIDGSGTTDIIYLGRQGVSLYFNQSGNSLSDPQTLPAFPPVDDLSSVTAVDLKGSGTACLVWSSALPSDAQAPMRYIDLMGGIKPHLLVRVANNLGAETRITYTPSTTFYLADQLAGTPWITRIPFPVHVVERVETFDCVSGSRFVTHYAYHHGYYDGVEREFHGFGMVEQRDTEEFDTLSASPVMPCGAAPGGSNIDAASHVPPMVTRTWFHTGVFLDRAHISDFFAGMLPGAGVGEYYREPGLTNDQARALLLEDTVLPDGLTPEEQREACRALRGQMLRQEIYAEDGQSADPYSVTEQNFTIRCLQPQGPNRYGVFFTHSRESISYHYERNPADPRIAHALTLAVDDFGNVLRSASVGYPRRQPDPALPLPDQPRQRALLITYMENEVTNPIDAADDYRAPLPAETRQYELTGLDLPAGQVRFTFTDLLNAGPAAAPIAYEQSPSGGLQKRLIERAMVLYRRDDLAGPLPPGVLEPLGLPYETYQQALTPGLVSAIYAARVNDAMLAADGAYAHPAGDPGWWIPSGQVFYSPGSADSPAQELAYARAHFFLPLRFRDPFYASANDTETAVRYDDYDLLVLETRDALGNRVTAGERAADPTQPLVRRGLDYRVLQPALVMDPNRNRSQVIFDTLGLVAASALMGKPEDSPALGDSLPPGYPADLTQAQIDAFFADPRGTAAALLGSATTRVVYDVTGYWREPDPLKKPPVYAAALARETHASEPPPPGGLKLQINFSYSDGFGREIQKKIQAEPGPAPMRDADGQIITGADGQPQMTAGDVNPRWVGSGWTVFNNKGKPVRQFEPFFTDTHHFEADVRIGVSPVLFYDPLSRVVATLHPNHSWEKVIFDPWRQENWDVNDTVLVADPGADPQAGDFFRRLPDADYLPTWYDQRQGGGLGPREQAAAQKAAVHAGTPAVQHLDTLGRVFLTEAHNRSQLNGQPPVEEVLRTRAVYDIEGNLREVRDERVNAANALEERAVVRYDYDMLGGRIHQASMEAGERWLLNDAAGKPIYTWDSRAQRARSVYDTLRRPIQAWLSAGGTEIQVGRTDYGEAGPGAETNNLRGRVLRVADQAGQVTTTRYDFKGNPLRIQRRLAVEYRAALDWSGSVALEPPAAAYTTQTRYDALDRAAAITTPDGSTLFPIYNEAGLLEQVGVALRGAALVSPFVTNIDYDAKGQRARIDYGSGVSTTYTYDPLTFRLAQLLTARPAPFAGGDCPAQPQPGWPGCQVQNLSYTYDPAGNVTDIRDDAQQTVFFDNRRVDPSAEYTYDALYRLIEASGRERLGSGGLPAAPDPFDTGHTHLNDPRNGQAMGRYVQRYVYDAVGNLLSMQHRGLGQGSPGWTRTYTYNEPSQLEPLKMNNRLSSTGLGPTTETYAYDASPAADRAGQHGSITAMPHLPLMRWDYRDELQATSQQSVSSGIPETTWYVYDAAGQRVRKVTDRQAGSGQTPTRRKERIYLGSFEIYREYEFDGSTIKLERETLHVMDDKQRVALVETRTHGHDGSPGQLVRYQFSNHLGSAVLELDDMAQVITYEEYYPYGSTSYQAARSKVEAPKRYRFTGKERDEENGLGYYGARYYAPWLGRWVSADPIGIRGGLNLYAYAHNSPVLLTDPGGLDPQSPDLVFTANFTKAGAGKPESYDEDSNTIYLTADKYFTPITERLKRHGGVGGNTPTPFEEQLVNDFNEDKLRGYSIITDKQGKIYGYSLYYVDIDLNENYRSQTHPHYAGDYYHGLFNREGKLVGGQRFTPSEMNGVESEWGPIGFIAGGIVAKAGTGLLMEFAPKATTVGLGWVAGTSIGEAATGKTSGVNPTRWVSGDLSVGRELSVGERIFDFTQGVLILLPFLTMRGPKEFTQKDVKKAMKRLDKKGIKASPAQGHIDPDSVIKLANKMRSGEFQNELMDQPVIRDSVNNVQLSGHHRTVASEMTGFDLNVTNVPAGSQGGQAWSDIPLKPGRRK